jgi:hypothetical protein
MFFSEDNSSGVSGDLHSATYLTALMESYWGMGSGVTSLPALQELEIMGGKAMRKRPVGTIGITEREPARNQPDLTPDVLGERIEFNLVRLLEKTEALLQEHRREVLCLAHALETHKTLNGDDVVAIIRGQIGPLIDGTIYSSDELYQELEEYHRDAARAHKEHSHIDRDLPGRIEEEIELQPVAFGGPGVTAVHLPASAHIVPVATGPIVPVAEVLAAGPPDRPEFVPWAPAAPAMPLPVTVQAPPVVGPPVIGAPVAGPAASPRRTAARLWLVIASLLGLVALSIIAALAVTGTMAGGGSNAAVSSVASPGLLLLLFVVVVAVIVGAGLAIVAIKGVRAAQAKAERERDQAHARAQLLAAAMDPDTAMRLLGYDGNGTDGRTGV